MGKVEGDDHGSLRDEGAMTQDRVEGHVEINGHQFEFEVRAGDEWGWSYRITEREGCEWSGVCPDFMEAFDCALTILRDIREGRER